MTPVRLRLSRATGFDLQEHSRSVNGLPATMVARPTRWGNPYKVAPAYQDAYCSLPEITPELAVICFRERMEQTVAAHPSVRESLDELRGRNLACWCSLDAPCHADVLLDLANRPVCDDPLAPADPLDIAGAAA